MERPYSHSRPPTFSSINKPPPLFSSSSSSSSSFHNNNGGFFTTSYDDVFGGPPKFASSSSLAPRAEDYSEIFGCLRSSSSSSSLRASSSIPVLDLPAIPDDVHSAAAFFDYSEVFGGFNAVDFAVPFDQLFRPCQGSFCDADADADASSDEAWTPAGSESLSDDSDPFAFSEKSQCFSSENSHQPSESKQFNVSYHKVNPGTSTYTPNTTHVAQLNDVPGYTCVVDEASSLREVGKETFSPVDDNNHFRVASPSDVSPKHTRKNMSHASSDSTVLKSYNSDCRSDKASNSIISHPKPAFASVTDINLRTEPSHLPPPSRKPPVVADRNAGFEEHNSSFVASEKCGLEPIVDDSLPSFFDMEVDASSSAAASAAAMKDAMDRAQEKFRAAKESRGRKDKVQNSGKLHLEPNINGGENVQGPSDDTLHGDFKAHTETDRGSIKVKHSTKARHARKASLDLLDILAGEHPNSLSEKPADTKQGKKSSMSTDTTFTDAAGQWKEAKQYYEFVNNDNTGVATQPPSNNDNAKTAAKQQGGDDYDSDSAGEACVTAENRRRLKATKAVSRQGYYEKMVKVAQEVHDNVIYGHVEPEKRLKCMSQGYLGKQKPEFIYEPGRNEVPLCKAQNVEVRNQSETIWKGEAEMRSKNVFEKEESKSEAFHSEPVDRNAEIPYDSMFEGASEVRDGETFVRGRHDQRVEEHCQKLRTDSRVGELPEKKRNKETRQGEDKEPYEGVLGDRMQTELEVEKKDNPKDLLQKKAADKRLKEAFEDGSGMERLQRSCETIENDKMQNLQQKSCNYENYHEEAAVGQGSMKMFEKCVELEKSQIEASKHVRGMVYEACSRTVDSKNSNGQKQNEIKEKFEKSTDVEHKSLHEPEQENTMKSDENTVDKEDQKGAYTSRINIEGEDEDEVLDSSPDRVPTEDEYVELKISSELKKPQKTADVFTKVISTTSSEEISNFEAVTTADVVNAENQIDPAAKAGPTDIDEHGERSVRASGEVEDNNTKIGSDCTRNEQTLEEEKRKAAQLDSDPYILKDLNVEMGGKRHLMKDNHEPVDHANKVGPTHAEEMDGFNEHSSKEEAVHSVKIGSDCTRNGQTPKEEKRKAAQLDSDPNMLKDLNVEIGGKRHLMGEDQVPVDHVNKFGPTHAEEMDGFTELSSKEEAVHSVLPEGKETFQNIPHQPKLGQSIERKGKTINRSLSSEEKDEEKERNLETERLRKIEEERERLREREKDRMAVELAVREARDRAFADARDRAERAALEKATDEARQRAMAEARERLEKACAEARERSSADKTSEARSRTERAALERANAEARQRAIEKAKADRVTFEARERMQRSVSEKYTSERDVIMRQSSFPTSSERFETAYGEPAQRCKARLERHRRTVERVANALAEKNMRDNLAQREQAERTRFAETLDADIRRWSSGKEGNLRALLSTLQYILGPDSGWHPIPLTEVITAAAVKKAYRKATLCVHPDKLQQRGATIQQKYICEKVFDLLKEAWNRFNSEEK